MCSTSYQILVKKKHHIFDCFSFLKLLKLRYLVLSASNVGGSVRVLAV